MCSMSTFMSILACETIQFILYKVTHIPLSKAPFDADLDILDFLRQLSYYQMSLVSMYVYIVLLPRYHLNIKHI